MLLLCKDEEDQECLFAEFEPTCEGFPDELEMDWGSDPDWEQPTSKEPKGKKVQLEWPNSNAYIRSFVDEMDWKKVFVRNAHHFLVTMHAKGRVGKKKNCSD